MTKNRVTLNSGREGPKEDPYGYQELCVYIEDAEDAQWVKGGVRFICHIGLGVWIARQVKDYRGQWIGNRESCNEENYEEVFKELTGDTAENWIEAYMEEHKDDVEDPMGCLADYE